MWQIYDELLSLLPKDNSHIKRALTGLYWFLVHSEGVGIAMTPPEGNSNLFLPGRISGKPVREVAQLIKSWDFYEGALGLATINSVLNTPERVRKTFGVEMENQPKVSVFEHLKEEITGKKVAVIGHFRDLEPLASICQLSILERRPLFGDYPDPACEYILPEQEYVFITATTLINKTLPRLLELSKNAYVVLVGPSTPLTPILFNYGIDMLAGTLVLEPSQVWSLIEEGDRHEFFQKGAGMVKVRAKDWQERKANGQ